MSSAMDFIPHQGLHRLRYLFCAVRERAWLRARCADGWGFVGPQPYGRQCRIEVLPTFVWLDHQSDMGEPIVRDGPPLFFPRRAIRAERKFLPEEFSIRQAAIRGDGELHLLRACRLIPWASASCFGVVRLTSIPPVVFETPGSVRASMAVKLHDDHASRNCPKWAASGSRHRCAW
jgi:hypothetical protein